MPARPDPATLKVHCLREDDYDADVRKHTSAWYEGFVRPGTYYHHLRHAVVLPESLLLAASAPKASWERRKARLQIGHEVGHAEDEENGTRHFDHPGDQDDDRDQSIFRHALRRGFDLRAASWTVRWRIGRRWRKTYLRGLALVADPSRIVRGPWPPPAASTP